MAMSQTRDGKTAFVLAGGGSLGAVQVGMLKALSRRGAVPDFVLGSSAGAINAAYYAAQPTEDGVARLEQIWLRLHRANIFAFSALNGLLFLLGRRGHLASTATLEFLITSELPYQHLEQSSIQCLGCRQP